MRVGIADSPAGRAAAAALLSCALGLLACPPTPARAGDFKVPLCNPDLNPGHKFTYQRNSDRFRSSIGCDGDGNGLEISFQGPSSSYDKWGRWTTTIPAGLSLRAYNVKAHIRNDGGHVGRVCVEMDSGNYDCRGTEAGSFQNVSWDTGGGRTLLTRLGCFKTSGCTTGDPHIYAKRFLLTLQDSTPPLVDIGGPLFTAGTKSGTQFATVSARDSESGVAEIRIEVNGEAYGAPIIQNCDSVAGHEAWYVGYKPCPNAVGESAAIDTERLPFVDGANTVRFCVTDVASPDTGTRPNTDCEQGTVDVDNSCPSSTPGGTELVAGFGPTRSPTTTVTYGVGALAQGRLVDGDGDGVAGALVCVTGRDLYEGARFARVATVRTAADGTWSTFLPKGPSRSLRAVYRDGANVRERALDVLVRSRPPFKLSDRRLSTGDCLQLSGALPEPNNGGRVVTLQGRARGAPKWAEFMTATTKEGGKFRKRYCFRATTVSTTYELRALIRQQNRYPYRSGTSRVRRVRVRVD